MPRKKKTASSIRLGSVGPVGDIERACLCTVPESFRTLLSVAFAAMGVRVVTTLAASAVLDAI